MRHSLPSCHLSLIQCFYWTWCALLPPIHKLLIVNANSIGSNFAFVVGQECFKLVLSPGTSYNKITIQSCSCRSSCAYLIVCWVLKRQILIALPASPFFSHPTPLLLLATWSHHLPCTISFGHQNPPPFLSAHSPSRKSPFLAALVFCRAGKLNQLSEEPGEGWCARQVAEVPGWEQGERGRQNGVGAGPPLAGGCGLAGWLAHPTVLKQPKTSGHFTGCSNWTDRFLTFL